MGLLRQLSQLIFYCVFSCIVLLCSSRGDHEWFRSEALWRVCIYGTLGAAFWIRSRRLKNGMGRLISHIEDEMGRRLFLPQNSVFLERGELGIEVRDFDQCIFSAKSLVAR
jgi:hypothetical protein